MACVAASTYSYKSPCAGHRHTASNRRVARCSAVRKSPIGCEPRDLTKVALKTAVTSTLTATLPAMAIVDDRLNGDGTGLPLGINDGALGIVLATIPLAIFSLYFFAGQQDGEIIAGGEDDDSGLSL